MIDDIRAPRRSPRSPTQQWAEEDEWIESGRWARETEKEEAERLRRLEEAEDEDSRGDA